MSTVEQIPEVLDLHIRRGDSFTRRFTFTMSGSPLDVSSWTITAQVREYAEADTATDFDVDMSDAVNGNVDLTLTEAQTTLLPETNEWDFQADIAGYVITLFAGAVTCERDVTR